MTTRDWQIEGARGKCARTGRALPEGEEFYTVLYEDGESFRREDISLDAWEGPPEGSFCHFKTRVPVKAKKRRLLVDDEVLVGLFQRLAEETDALRIQFRFVLALILMRKRILRYDSSGVADGVETWQMNLASDQSTHRVVNPQLTDEQIDGVSAQLSAILHGDAAEAIAGDAPFSDDVVNG
ncbi:MAG: hypothetical protein HY287_11375 [Planctomycetes bacterium]|nr:hypothetical protein [Planctomycetota bacterium]MBI3834920.1 hypothetical protein [Planctomycetota bacterium]